MESETPKYELSTLNPEGDLAIGARAADTLVKIVRKAGLAKKFGGDKEHLFYEAWQSLAKFYGCTVRTRDAEAVEVEGIRGAKAKADIVDDTTGMVVGGAEAYCMRDEKNWSNKPWFQLASMAQTRAGSKACRNKWAFIPALVGFATTPAEEMDGIIVENGKHEPAKSAKEPEAPQAVEYISDAQRKRWWAICKGVGASDKQIKDMLYRKWNIEHSKNIPRNLYETICTVMESELINEGAKE